MNILNGFEGDILMAHSPNVIELENCSGDVFISVTGIDINVGFTRRSFQGNLSVDFYEVLRTAFTDYVDNFDYGAGVETTTLWQHTVDFDDGVNAPITFNIRVVNGALQVGGSPSVADLANLHFYDCEAEYDIEVELQNAGVTVGDSVYTTDIGIAYTAPSSGDLLTIEADLSDAAGLSGDFFVKVFEGNGYGGTQVYSGGETVVDGATLSHTLTTPLAMVEGDTYTVQVTRDTATQIRVSGYVSVNPNTSGYVQYYGDGASVNQYFFNTLTFTDQSGIGYIQGRAWEGYPFSTSAIVSNAIDRTPLTNGLTPISTDCNLEIIDGCEGIYFKWLNTLGGYDYWLFNEQYSEAMATKSIGAVEKYYQDRQTTLSLSDDIGRDTTNSIKISSNVPTRLKRHIEGILMSPEVYLYEGDQGTAGLDWIKVVVKNGNYSLGRGSDNTIVFKTEVALPRNYSQLI